MSSQKKAAPFTLPSYEKYDGNAFPSQSISFALILLYRNGNRFNVVGGVLSFYAILALETHCFLCGDR